MVDKRRRRPSILWLPRWAWPSLGLFLVVTALQPWVGPHVHLLPLYLLPVLLASQGGVGPGLAMMAAALVASTAMGVGMGRGASALAAMTDGCLLLGVGSVLVLRFAVTQRQVARYRREGSAAGELLRFARHTGSPTDLPLLLRSIADVGSRLLGADYGATFLWDARSKQFRAAQQSAAAEQAGVRFSGMLLPAAGSPVIAQLLRDRAALSVADAARAPDWAQVVQGLPICRTLLVPAVSWGRVLGCLLFGRERTGLPFQEQHSRLGQAMAEYVAVALEHADAFQELERQADQIRRLNRDLERQNARLIELEQLRNDLVRMIVHDMRTPLAAVIASMRWVEREAGAGLAPPLAEANRVGRQSAEELLGMVNDLLDVARMEEGHLDLDPCAERVAVLAAAAREATRYLASDRHLEMGAEIPPGLPEVCVDRDKVIRVLVNLIANAIKFTPSGGRITVSARAVDAEWIAVTVEDTGEGIPLQDQDRIFEKFGQVKARQGGRTMSTGLGLAFCKMAVEAHGGRIRVASRPGEGARFTFTLPVARAATPDGSSAGAP
jgi:signal transduction histidine kinase